MTSIFCWIFCENFCHVYVTESVIFARDESTLHFRNICDWLEAIKLIESPREVLFEFSVLQSKFCRSSESPVCALINYAAKYATHLRDGQLRSKELVYSILRINDRAIVFAGRQPILANYIYIRICDADTLRFLEQCRSMIDTFFSSTFINL